MQQLACSVDDRTGSLGETTDLASSLDVTEVSSRPLTGVTEVSDDLLSRPLTEAKRLAASAFERRYLLQVMERARGSVSQGARLSGLDRTNFRRLLHRHGLHATLAHVVRL